MDDSGDEDLTNDTLIIDDIFGARAKPSSSSGKSTPSGGTNSAASNANTRSINGVKRKKRDSASSDEERWLTAIESGTLEDVDDELKKIKPKDPALMTARQRAMYDRGAFNSSPQLPSQLLMSLPTGYKEKIMTAESIQKAAIKSQKRKKMADEKRESDKKKTMDRLLKKQEIKSKLTRPKSVRGELPTMLYHQTIHGSTLRIPDTMSFLQEQQLRRPKREPVYCKMGCGNIKKYSCSKTHVPLCSLECYKLNINKRIV